MNMMLYTNNESTRGAAVPSDSAPKWMAPETLRTWSIGFDRQLDMMKDMSAWVNMNGRSYPPYDIIKFSDDEYAIDMAVAGYSRDDIEIQVDNGILIVEGSKPAEFEDEELLHKGIAKRAFTQKFGLAEHMEVIGAKTTDGILRIDLERRVPEELKPRKIEIN